MGGILAGMLGGAAAAGLEAIKTNEANTLQEQRDARLAERQAALQASQEARADARFKTQLEIQDKRDAANQVRHDQTIKVQSEANRIREKQVDNSLAGIMARIASKENGSDKEEKASRIAATFTAQAKEAREQGNTALADSLLKRATAALTGDIGDTVIPPKPAAGPAVSAGPTDTGATRVPAQQRPSPTPAPKEEWSPDPSSPAGVASRRRADAAAAAEKKSAALRDQATKEAEWALQSGDRQKLSDFQASPGFSLLDRATKEKISSTLMGK